MTPTSAVEQYWDCTLITADDFARALVALLCDGDRRAVEVVRCVTNWLAETERAAKPALCLSCDAAFSDRRRPRGFVIILPMFDGELAITTGICPRCYQANERNLETYVIQSVRKYWPEVRVAQIGHA